MSSGFNIFIRYSQIPEYGHELEKDIKGELSGDFLRLMRAILAGARDESPIVNPVQAQGDAQVNVDS
jgi:hypothetical protein